MLKQHYTQIDYSKFNAPRQMTLPFDFGVMIPENEPVRLFDAILEDLNYDSLYQLYSSKGRKSAIPPRILLKILLFAMSEGIFALRKIQRQCEVNLQYKWLLEGYPVPSHMTFQRFQSRLTTPVLEDLFVQIIEKIVAYDSITFDEVFIDGTKLEANANRYSFVWRGSIEKYLAKLPAKLDACKKEAMELLGEDLYDYDTEALIERLEAYVKEHKIEFVHGIGKRKTPAQRILEKLREIRDKWMRYESNLEIMGERNSFSKTDHDETFMRMKEDHMLNGQLKPGYNLQVAAHSEYILGLEIFPNPTDTRTFIPFMKHLERTLHTKFKYVVADAGYDSEENLTWLFENGYTSCIKPSTHERSKTRKWKNDIGRAENMNYCAETDTFTCVNGNTLAYQYTTNRKTKSGFIRSNRVYAAESCEGCPHRKACQKYKGEEPPKRPKHLYIAHNYTKLLELNKETFSSAHGTCLRVNRSIQVEGVFGILKQDLGFRRLQHRGTKNVYKQLMLVAMGYNLKKLHNRNINGRLGIRLFQENLSA